MQEDKKTNSAWACASSAIAGSFVGVENSESPEVLNILDDLARAAKELIIPHQKRLGVFDFDEYTFYKIRDAVLRAHSKVQDKMSRKLTLNDKELVLNELKSALGLK